MISSILLTIISSILLAELLFAIYYFLYLRPNITKLAKTHRENPDSKVYRDYDKKNRSRLFLRILSSIEQSCQTLNKPFAHGLETFLHGWMEVKEKSSSNPSQKKLYRNSSAQNSLIEEEKKIDYVSLQQQHQHKEEQNNNHKLSISKTNVDELMAWAMYEKDPNHLTPCEEMELQKVYSYIHDNHQITIETKPRNEDLEPMRHSLEIMNPKWRPFFAYVIVYFIYYLGVCFLVWAGFRRYTSKSGLVYWYFPGTIQSIPSKENAIDSTNLLPLIFFHGIAPCGIMLYSPMIYYGFMKRFQSFKEQMIPPTFLFENQPIAYLLSFNGLSEPDTIDGIKEAFKTHLPLSNTKVSLMGHSFGSVPITWCMHAIPEYISQIILIDPVTILLHEPDVTSNFFHRQGSKFEEDLMSENATESTPKKELILTATSDIALEFYLRHVFSWYNGALWLEDIPDHVSLVICLSKQDCIVPTEKIKREVRRWAQCNPTCQNEVSIFEWKEGGHGDSIANPDYWRDIFLHMMKQQVEMKK